MGWRRPNSKHASSAMDNCHIREPKRSEAKRFGHGPIRSQALSLSLLVSSFLVVSSVSQSRARSSLGGERDCMHRCGGRGTLSTGWRAGCCSTLPGECIPERSPFTCCCCCCSCSSIAAGDPSCRRPARPRVDNWIHRSRTRLGEEFGGIAYRSFRLLRTCLSSRRRNIAFAAAGERSGRRPLGLMYATAAPCCKFATIVLAVARRCDLFGAEGS
ncbi:hypothetical protein BO71DRAFT_74247 [Aspergillus ellipticus CBS 707.79]|uniref:Uncharacterized protein n=1 Tax=Aspergillus ellipticus CBS 707.79 TaxID=1448320 RepID=A0A319CZN8_9EURO|nr:hypothetical protein BO71DRAFT_74247 [Aspergillus ellipticus CBS 707.79]